MALPLVACPPLPPAGRQPFARLRHPLLVGISLLQRAGIAGSIVLLFLCLSLAQNYNETEVKAAFLYHFIGYVEWPARAFDSPASPFVVGVLGKSAVLDALREAVRGKSVQGRAVTVRQVQIGQELRQCHLLFIPAPEMRNLSRVLEVLGEAPVLLVGESEGFTQRGGIINFFLEQNKLRFEINPDAAKRVSLNISSKLLRLARVVRSS